MATCSLRHSHDRVGEEQPVVLIEPGGDEVLNPLSEHVFDVAQGARELGIVGNIAAEEKMEGVGV
jgi:hypothetical protein